MRRNGCSERHQLHRGAALPAFPLAGAPIPLRRIDHRGRSSARYAADSEDIGPAPRMASSNTNRRGPQYGRDRRNSNGATSTPASI